MCFEGPSSVKELVSCSCMGANAQVSGSLSSTVSSSQPTPSTLARAASAQLLLLWFSVPPVLGALLISFTLLQALSCSEKEVCYSWSGISRCFAVGRFFLSTVLPLYFLKLEIKEKSTSHWIRKGLKDECQRIETWEGAQQVQKHEGRKWPCRNGEKHITFFHWNVSGKRKMRLEPDHGAAESYWSLTAGNRRITSSVSGSL